MQHRMKTHQLTELQITDILKNEHIGTIATVNENGTPYVTPIHFVYKDGKLYFHGLPAGQKIENIKKNSSVSFNTYHMDCYLLDEEGKPCDTNTKYQSVNIQGTAAIIEDSAEKREVLGNIIKKYTPHLADRTIPDNAVNGTCVAAIDIKEMTGKYWE